jgi:WD40 repeat protein
MPPHDVTVWDVARQEELCHIELPPISDKDYSRIVQFSPDGRTFAVIVHLHGDKLTNVPFQRFLVERSVLKFFDVGTRREIRSIEVAGNVYSLCFSPDGKRLAGRISFPAVNPPRSTPYQFTVWDIASGHQVFVADSNSLGVEDTPETGWFMAWTEWTPDGKRLVIEGRGGAAFLFLDAETGKVVSTLNTPPRGILASRNMAAFSSDGRRVAIQHVMRNQRTVVSVLDADGGKELLTLPLPNERRAAGRPFELTGARLVFTPDGHQLLRFKPVTTAGGRGPDGERLPARTGVRVTTWDATPRPEAKGP